MEFFNNIRTVVGLVGSCTLGECFIFLATLYNSNATGIVNGFCELSTILFEHKDVKSYNFTTSSSLPKVMEVT